MNRLDEGVFDEVRDYLITKGILELKYRDRVIKNGASDLNKLIGPIGNLEDDELLHILKILKKRGNTSVFGDVGFTNLENDTRPFTFLDIAIRNHNYNCILWIIDNATGFYCADEKSIDGFFRYTYNKYPEWIKAHGYKFLLMLLNTNHSAKAREAVYTALNELFDILIAPFHPFDLEKIKFEDTIEKAIPFVLFDPSFGTIIQKLIYSFMLLRSDDTSIYYYLMRFNSLDFDNYFIFRHSIKDGKIRQAIIDDEKNYDMIKMAVEICNLDITEWVNDTIKEIFLF